MLLKVLIDFPQLGSLQKETKHMHQSWSVVGIHTYHKHKRKLTIIIIIKHKIRNNNTTTR